VNKTLTFQGEVTEGTRCLLLWMVSRTSSIPASRHFSRHKRLSSARNRQLRHVWAARRRSRGSRNDSTYSANCNQMIGVHSDLKYTKHCVITKWITLKLMLQVLSELLTQIIIPLPQGYSGYFTILVIYRQHYSIVPSLTSVSIFQNSS
jgi:hypothetical protein